MVRLSKKMYVLIHCKMFLMAFIIMMFFAELFASINNLSLEMAFFFMGLSGILIGATIQKVYEKIGMILYKVEMKK